MPGQNQDEQLQELITQYERRLHLLRLRRAREGISVDPSVIIEIEDTEAELKKLLDQRQGPAQAQPDPEPEPARPADADSDQYHSCFISYSSRDETFANRLYADLQRAGVRCWFAPEDMKIGARIRDSIDAAIPEHSKLLLILSHHSITSDWVEQEVETAFEQERDRGEVVLFPIRLDNKVMEMTAGWAAHIKRSRNIGNFENWQDAVSYQPALQRLLRDLRRER